MRSQATIFVICLILHFVNSQKCVEQGDCTAAGKRCVFNAAKGLAVACEILPDKFKSQCRCKRGCLLCGGNTSRFIKQGKSVRLGCGLNTCGCTNAATNQMTCTLAACVGEEWVDHCPAA